MKVTLNYWAKGRDLILNQQTGTIIERIYINDLDGNSLGFWERREEVNSRGQNSYYDRHRIAKGDAVITENEAMRFVSESLSEQAVLAAIGVGDAETEQANRDNGGGLFAAISRKSRGGKPTWYGNTPKKEAKRLEKLQDTAVYELA